MAAIPTAVQPSPPGAADLDAPPPGRTAPDRRLVRLPGLRSAGTGPRSAVRSWPLLVLAAPAAAEVWSGWVGIAARTGFGLVSPLPGIWPSLHIDTTITLPVGVEAYAAYALRAWLAPAGAVSARTRRFARRSAIFSFALGGAGQVAYHLLEQARITQAPWPVTTIVSCLPVLVLAMGTALAHLLHADAMAWSAGPDGPACRETGRPAVRSAPERTAGKPEKGPPGRTTRASPADRAGARADGPLPPGTAATGTGPDRLLAARLVAAGQPVSRRALRTSGVRGSNAALNALARMVNDELARSGAGRRLATAAPT